MRNGKGSEVGEAGRRRSKEREWEREDKCGRKSGEESEVENDRDIQRRGIRRKG